nr:hypothetical protein [uncultured Pseudodesulfovibrio sp.]
MTLDHVSRAMLARKGQPVIYTSKDGVADGHDALVKDHGFGMPPSGWDSEFFEGMARYVEFKIPYEVLSEEPQYSDSVTFDGREYEVRAAKATPETGADKVWWVVYGVADQRGSY